jgi:methionyl aminopeptidase
VQQYAIVAHFSVLVLQHSGFAVVDDFTGHGIGTEFHMLPYIVHTPNTYGGLMEEGMTFTIEPVVVEGRPTFRILADKWTAVSRDKGRGAQTEHTVLITPQGAEILTIAK